MESSERFYDPRTIARVGRLELRAQMIVEGIITGLHKSPYQGQSVEFVDHRPYVPGDDPRHIDWKVLGRADRIVLKRFEEETNLRAHILLDVSESMRYTPPAGLARGPGLSKFEHAGTLAACLAYLLHRQQDSVGLTLFDSEVRESMPPSTSSAALLRLGEILHAARPEAKSGLGKVLEEVAQGIPRRGLVALVSDLFVPMEELRSGLEAFALRRHDVLVFHVLDATELTFPFEGNTLFHGLEGWPEVLADPRSVREAYLEALAEYLGRVERICATQGVHYTRVDTSQSFDAPILAAVATREAVRRRRR